jgi:hypothetical protein
MAWRPPEEGAHSGTYISDFKRQWEFWLHTGTIAQAMGVRQALLIGAIGVLLSAIWLVFSPVRRLRELPHAVEGIRA